MSDQIAEGYRHIGTGQAVFESAEAAEGVVRFLDSPQDVLAFVQGDAAPETIVLARGGTTTFLAPALSARVRGIMTLQGAPESHLGILSREFGIPCVMRVEFSEGVQTSRGETIPADGTKVRLDVSAGEQGHIYAEGEA